MKSYRAYTFTDSDGSVWIDIYKKSGKEVFAMRFVKGAIDYFLKSYITDNSLYPFYEKL